jgi:glycosyltransferase involved in cell wall biosynthesis
MGDGEQRLAMEQQIRAHDLQDRVSLLPYGDPRPLYRAIDALLLPSAREGLSLVNLEAMSIGRPVLRTQTAGTGELISEGETGRSTPIDRETFVDTALNFLSDRDSLSRMGQNAAELVRTHYTFQHQVDATVALYRQLINQKSASP